MARNHSQCPICFGSLWNDVCSRCGVAIGRAKPTKWRPDEKTIASGGAESIGRSSLDNRASFDDVPAKEMRGRREP